MNFIYIAFIGLCFVTLSCKKDNREEPQSQLTGRLHYRGEAIEVEYDRVPFDLFQYGFGQVGPISTTVAPEGTYSHLLFDGEYKLLIRPGQGPFWWPQTGGKADSITVTVNGNTVRDIEVEPYHMIRNPQFSYAAGTVTATFRIDKIITDALRAKNIQEATLFINKTQFVSPTDNVARTNIAGSAITNPASVSLNVAVPAMTPAQNYVFARIGVKTVDVEDWIFSPVQRIQL